MMDLIIPDGQTLSNIILAREQYADADSIGMIAPLTITGGGTITIEVSDDERATAASIWRTLQIGDPYADANPPPAAKARTYYELPTYAAFRLKASVVISGGAAAVWKLTKAYAS